MSRGATAIVGVGALYFLAGKLALDFASIQPTVSPVWPPTGIALASLLVLGQRVWPAIFAGALLVNITTTGSAAAALGIAAGNTLEAVVGAALVQRCAGGRHAFDRVRDIFKFVAVAALASTAISATIGVTSLALAGYAPWTDVKAIWLTWWLGDAAGALVVTPALLLWSAHPRLRARARDLAAFAVILVVVVLTGAVVFGGVLPAGMHNFPLAFLVLPGLVWAAFRFGPREASTLVVVLAVIAVAGTFRGLGPYAPWGVNTALLLLQAFMATTTLTVLSVAALVWERERAESARRGSETGLRLAIAAAGMGAMEWHVASGRVTCSASYEAIHGLAPGSFPGTFEAFVADIHPDDRDRVLGKIKEGVARGSVDEVLGVEYRIIRPDGQVRWMEGRGELFTGASGRPDRMRGICVDVTGRKEADEERARLLRQEQTARQSAEEAERRLEVLGQIARSISASLDLGTVLERIVDGARVLCRTDTAAIFLRERDSDIDVMVSRQRLGSGLPASALRITPGRGPAARVMATGRPLRMEHDPAAPQLAGELEAIVEATGAVSVMVVPILIHDRVEGLLYVGHRAARPFTEDDEGVCTRLAEQATIAIQNARLFARQDTARAEAEAASDAKDEFLAMLGHELRNPLGAISSAVQVLNRLSDGEGRGVRARGIIERQVKHLGRLVDDLLDVSRVVTGKIVLQRDLLDLAEVVQRSLHAVAPADRTGYHRLAVDARPAWVYADSTRLEQVVTNLVTNALKYTPAGGEVLVSVRPEGDRAVLSVLDTGMGIAPELLPRIFDIFVQGERSLDRAPGGLGIGLTLVRRLVELHGGTVEATSEGLGRGSTFSVRLPLAPPPGEGTASESTTSAPIPSRVLAGGGH